MTNLHDTELKEEELFEDVRKLEESVLEAGRHWAKTVGETLPMEMPVAREVVKGVFDFTEAILTAQREFAHRMLKATMPEPAVRHRAHKTPATRTKKVA